MFKVLRTGKRKKKEWKRMVTKVGGGQGQRGVAWGWWQEGRAGAVVASALHARRCKGCHSTGSPLMALPSRSRLPPAPPPTPPRLQNPLRLCCPPQVTFVPPGFTRKPPKYERFIRPTGLRMAKAHVTHPELKATFQLEIIGVKKNPNGQAYTGLGVVTKGEGGAGAVAMGGGAPNFGTKTA